MKRVGPIGSVGKLPKRISRQFAGTRSPFAQCLTTCASFFYTGSVNLRIELLIISIFLFFASVTFGVLYRMMGKEALDVRENVEAVVIDLHRVKPSDNGHRKINTITMY
ncbi:hypothetical protein Tcan_09922 [Toxocara canis]|uniref:Uncharacterized protein n=1 Tax=Toxocara canis TaxID=6265 RepID=A0A0B2V5V7_TOXCA|nr:hypothetical protein Tcan_09922 [Toxocara canis]